MFVTLNKNVCNLFFFKKLYLRNKTCFPCLHNLVKTEVNVWENSRADQWKPETQSRVFTSSRIRTNFAEFFNRLWIEARTTCFISFIKLLFSVLTKRKTMYEARTVNSHNSETVNHIAHAISCFIGLWKHTCRPIKTHVLSKLLYNIFWNTKKSPAVMRHGNLKREDIWKANRLFSRYRLYAKMAAVLIFFCLHSN